MPVMGCGPHTRPTMAARRGRSRPILVLMMLLCGLWGWAESASVERQDSVVIISSGQVNETSGQQWNSSAVNGEAESIPADADAEGVSTGPSSELWAKIRHLRQKVRLKESDDLAANGVDPAADYVDDPPAPEANQEVVADKKKVPIRPAPSWMNSTAVKNTFRLPASGTRKTGSPPGGTISPRPARTTAATTTVPSTLATTTDSTEATEMMDETQAPTTFRPLLADGATGAPSLENKLRSVDVYGWSPESVQESLTELSSTDSTGLDGADAQAGGQAEEVETETDAALGSSSAWPNDLSDGSVGAKPNLDIVTKFLRIVESQASLFGKNCTAGTELNLGDGVVDKYAQERFRLEAEVAVNRANWLTRLWKYADRQVLDSEYLLHANLLSIIEMDEDIFAAGNCYDVFQYKDYLLFCPFAYRLPDGPVLAKDLAVEYKYLGNDSEWFYVARKNAERVIRNMTSITKAFHSYTEKSDNDTAHTDRVDDEVLIVSYEDGKWSKPYFDCGGGNIWMMTYTVPFFGYANGSYFFKGTSGIDIDLRRVDIDQCPQRTGNTQLNIFAASDKCKVRTTKCTHIPGLGFRRGSYRCECKEGFYFPDKNSPVRYYNGSVIEEEYEKKLMGVETVYDNEDQYECLPCPEGCDVCEDDSPCIVTLNWVMRTTILILEIIVICSLPAVALFTWRYGHIKVVRAASPALLRLIILGAFFIYCTTLVAYFPPNIITCSLRVWLREIGFSFAYGALMLKTWRISVIFRVRSAKAVKITDLDLIKRLGIIVAIFTTFLAIRTMVGPPHVIVARTADDLKAYICQTDWWDHVFTAMEMSVLVWGIRLCIVVRKAPSEFNESRFISMAIYNEFLLSIFLNVSMLFLQSPANPDLMYIIMFSHTQLTTTLLLVLIFGSKAYLVLRGRGKGDDTATMAKPQAAKFLTKAKTNNSQHVTPSAGSSKILDIPGLAGINDPEIQAEIRRVFSELDHLKEKTARSGNNQFAARLVAMLQVARQAPGTAASTPAALTVAPDPSSAASISSILTGPASVNLENGPTPNGNGGVTTGGATVAFSTGSAGSGGSGAELRHRKSQSKGGKCKSPKNSPDSGLGGLMFGSSGGPHVNNVLACMTDKIVCATFSADPTSVAEDEEAEAVEEEELDIKTPNQVSIMSLDRQSGAVKRLTPVASAAPVASLALAAAPLLSFNTSGMAILRNYSAPNSRRNSYKPESISTPTSVQNVPLSFVGDYANYGALATTHNMPMANYTFDAASGKYPASQQSAVGASVTSLRTPTTPTTDGTLSVMSGQLATAERSLSADDESSELQFSLPPPLSPSGHQVSRVLDEASKRWSYPLSPQVVQKSLALNATDLPPSDDDNSLHNFSTSSNLERSPRRRDKRQVSSTIQVDCTVRSAQQQQQQADDSSQATPHRSRSRSRSRINTEDRERFTEEVTV